MVFWSGRFFKGLLFCLLGLVFINTKALASDNATSSALTHYIMGVMYEDTGDIDKAIQEYKQVLKADDKNSSAHLNLASSYIKKNDIPAAIEELKTTISLDPEAIEPHAILALLYTSENKMDLAAAEYEVALKGVSKLEPQNIDIYKTLGAIYLRQKKYKDAEETYKLIIKLAPKDAQAYYFLGSLYNEINKNDLAEKEIRQALKLKPDYHEALNFLGYLFVEQGRNLSEAETMIRKAIALDQENGAYIDSLGWLYFKKGDFKEALSLLEKASALIEDPVVYDHLGDTYSKLNDPAKAKLNWEKSLQLDPGQEKVKEKLGIK